MKKNKWRLPTIDELRNAFDYERGKPKAEGFTLDYYWSYTTHTYYAEAVWIVYFDDGYTDYGYRSSTYYARCVRDTGEDYLELSESSKIEMTWDKACEYCERMNNE